MLRKLVSLATAGVLAAGLGVGSVSAQSSADDQIGTVRGLFEAEPVVYQITFPRMQAIVVPSLFLDMFFDDFPAHWSNGQTNWAFGAEFIIRRLEQYDLVFSVDWADLRTTDDWWREDDKDLVDTDWGRNNLGLLTFDVAINWFTSVMDYWDIYYGVGLGVGFVVGDFLKNDIDQQCIRNAGVDPFNSQDSGVVDANCFDALGNPRLSTTSRTEEEDGIPPLIPALSFNVGSRWIIDRQWAVQLEVGFKNIYLYAGLELGFIFN
jgi:hypothetical protein